MATTGALLLGWWSEEVEGGEKRGEILGRKFHLLLSERAGELKTSEQASKRRRRSRKHSRRKPLSSGRERELERAENRGG